MRVWRPPLIVALVLGATVFGAAQEAPQTVWDGVYTEEQAERGAVIYRQACRKCHYADLSGAGDPDASPGEVPPGLVGVAFSDYWQELSLAELFLAIARGMPGDRPGTLTPQATADVVSYILQRNAFPAGSTELPAEPGLLERILIADQP